MSTFNGNYWVQNVNKTSFKCVYICSSSWTFRDMKKCHSSGLIKICCCIALSRGQKRPLKMEVLCENILMAMVVLTHPEKIDISLQCLNRRNTNPVLIATVLANAIYTRISVRTIYRRLKQFGSYARKTVTSTARTPSTGRITLMQRAFLLVSATVVQSPFV